MEGSHILQRVAITICFMIKDKILACKNFQQLFDLMDGDHSDIANDQLHKFLAIVACIGGNAREMKLEGITAEYVEEYRAQFAENKLRSRGE